MAYSASRNEFLNSNAAELLRKELQTMVDDPLFNTSSRYSYNIPNQFDFVSKHIDYMSKHLKMNHNQYILNLRLMTRITNVN